MASDNQKVRTRNLYEVHAHIHNHNPVISLESNFFFQYLFINFDKTLMERKRLYMTRSFFHKIIHIFGG